MQSASYNLFNYVNEVNAEVEALEDSIEKVRSEIEAHQEQASAHMASLPRAVLCCEPDIGSAWGQRPYIHTLSNCLCLLSTVSQPCLVWRGSKGRHETG